MDQPAAADSTTALPSPLGIYIHIPFCRRKCAYCDFDSYAGQDELILPYVDAVHAEIAASSLRGRVVDTVYIGGGTPSLLPPDLIASLLDACRQAFAVTADAEITMEANPGTVDPPALATLRTAGVDRLSLGAQSMHDAELSFLGRIHTVDDTRQAIEWAHNCGYTNISLDLIYGLPQQSLAAWQESLDLALALSPEHISAYALSIEEGTPLAASVACAEVPAPDADVAADMYAHAEARLAEAGYAHYELSNWARRQDGDVLVSRHNCKYWQLEDYRGFGSAAHSCVGGVRSANVAHPRAYIECVTTGRSPVATREPIPASERMAETMILGLRLVAGVSYREFARRHGRPLRAVYAEEIDTLLREGLLHDDGQRVCLTARGRLLANVVFGRFWPPRTAPDERPIAG